MQREIPAGAYQPETTTIKKTSYSSGSVTLAWEGVRDPRWGRQIPVSAIN